ncbi:DUF3099 domain-containing protein [Nocardioides caricicola]|uniref:DUF3099 domain-containing protein n=1 Tax=Nocardioides caricicola TaxID=634770 RepID=A0ABW0MZX8_9ACTN
MARDLRRDRDEAVRITTASSNRQDEIWARQRRYLFSMVIRTACFLGAIVASGWLRWSLVAAAVLLPYVAVVMANAVASKDDGFDLQEGAAGRMLGPGTAGERPPGS